LRETQSAEEELIAVADEEAAAIFLPVISEVDRQAFLNEV